MKAPHKIYIPFRQSYPNAPIEEGHTHLGADWFVSKCDQTAVGFQEYIRKEEILEWANNWEKIGVSDDFAYAIQTLIKHIESL